MLPTKLISLTVCCLVLLQAKTSNGQEYNDIIQALNSLETRLTDLIVNLNQTLSTCCQASSSCDAETIARQQWKLAFRGTAKIGKSVFAAFRDGTGIPVYVEPGCKQVGQSLPCENHYRNNEIIDNWRGISEVALVVYKDDIKVKQVIFDGTGTTYMTWLDKAKVIESSWLDMRSSGANYFSIAGHQDNTLRRTFFMNQAYGTCPNDIGWFVAIDSVAVGCSWEKNDGFPAFKYSTSDGKMNWNDAKIGSADYFAIFVKYFNGP